MISRHWRAIAVVPPKVREMMIEYDLRARHCRVVE
jgi:hypothetical protein